MRLRCLLGHKWKLVDGLMVCVKCGVFSNPCELGMHQWGAWGRPYYSYYKTWQRRQCQSCGQVELKSIGGGMSYDDDGRAEAAKVGSAK